MTDDEATTDPAGCSVTENHAELVCTCRHEWAQHHDAAGRRGFCLTNCGCRGFIGMTRRAARVTENQETQ